VRKNKKAGAAGSAFLLAIYFWFQIHIRALVLISPKTCTSILMLHVITTDLFTSIPVSTNAEQVLDGEHHSGLVEINSKGAVVS